MNLTADFAEILSSKPGGQRSTARESVFVLFVNCFL